MSTNICRQTSKSLRKMACLEVQLDIRMLVYRDIYKLPVGCAGAPEGKLGLT